MKMEGIHKIVAREMVAGIPLAEICSVRGLDPKKWKRITNSSMFQEELRRLQSKVEENFLSQLEQEEDDVYTLLRSNAKQVARSLIEEATSGEEDASPTSRIKASQSVLDMLGYSKGKTDDNVVVNITLSSGKKEALSSPASAPPEMPDNVKEDFLEKGEETSEQ